MITSSGASISIIRVVTKFTSTDQPTKAPPGKLPTPFHRAQSVMFTILSTMSGRTASGCSHGDNGAECQILRASCDFKHVYAVASGKQQARAVALVPTREALYFSSDTPFETNHIYRYSRRGILSQVAELNGSSIYGCRVGEAIFFSTMVEPSAVNRDRHVRIYGSADQASWDRLLEWKKDIWAMGLFQYGNAFLPDGGNTTNLLAITTVAVKKDDLQTTLWRV